MAVVATPLVGHAQHVSENVPHSTPLGSGPYKAILEADPRLPGFTVYRPKDLSALGEQKLPIVAWAEGGCANNGSRFRWFLSEIASHGYLVVAIGPVGPEKDEIWNPPPQHAGPATMPRMPDLSKLPPPATHSSQLIDAINWAVAENTRSGGRYLNRIAGDKVAVMGMSCGGGQAIEAGQDPRVVTTVMWNSGLFPDGTAFNAMFGGRLLTKADLKLLHGAVAYISGDESDIAFNNANDDFSRLPDIPALRAWMQTHSPSVSSASSVSR